MVKMPKIARVLILLLSSRPTVTIYLSFHFASLSHYPSPIQFTPRSFHWLSNVLPHSSEDGQVGGIIVVVTPEMGYLRKTVNIFH